jgi:WXG100 family type VII secretion target
VADQSAVDRAAMAQAAQKLDSAANVVKGIQTRLEGHKQELRSGWEGNASMAFERVFQAFNEDFSKVLTAMQGMHEKLVHTKIQYESSEQEQEAAVNKISALLNGST